MVKCFDNFFIVNVRFDVNVNINIFVGLSMF